MAAVGSFTFAITSLSADGAIKKVSIAWTSNASGAVSGASFQLPGGVIQQAKFVPTNGGTEPSNDYSFTLLDNDGADLLLGKGAGSGLSNTTASVALIGTYNDPTIGSPVSSVTPTVASAGNVTNGRVDLIIGP